MFKKSTQASALPLFLVVFIDGMGLGILFPVLGTIFLNPQYHFFTGNAHVMRHNIQYGLITGAYMAAWFFGAPWLSDLSDQIGRKRTLLISLLGTCIGYVLTIIGLMTHSVLWILLGRIIDGFTAGSQPIAQAAIVDLSPANEKSKSIGRVLMFMYLGFVMGPIVGGLLTDPSWVSWFSIETPVIVAAVLSLINAILLAILFKETFHVRAISIDVLRPFKLLAQACCDKKLVGLSVIFLLGELGWSFFFSYSGGYAVKVFGFTSSQLMYYMGVMGIGFVFGFGLLAGYFEKRMNPVSIVIVMYLICSAAMVLFFVIDSVWAVWLLIVPITAAGTTAYCTLLAMYSRSVGADRQGWVMGVSMAIVALSFAVTGFLGGVMLNVESYFPVLIALLLIFAAALTAFFMRGCVAGKQ